MLPKIARLTKRGSFTYVYNKGERKHDGFLTLIYVRSRALKIGFSVNNKIGNAVTRNKIKRRLRAIIRTLYKDIAPVQAVINVKTGATKLSFIQLRNSVIKLLQTAKLLVK